jgi:hypothetical protein
MNARLTTGESRVNKEAPATRATALSEVGAHGGSSAWFQALTPHRRRGTISFLQERPVSTINPCSPARRSMTEQQARIWFHPTRFWAASSGLPPESSEALLGDVLQLAERRDYEALRKYEFVSVEFRPAPKTPDRRATDFVR